MITRGTRLKWDTVGGWVDACYTLKARKICAQLNSAIRWHQRALPTAMIERETDARSLQAALHLLMHDNHFRRPARGHRASCPTTTIIKAIKNRLMMLKREDDIIPAGDNWIAANREETT